MNSSQFMDKQILDLMNPPKEPSQTSPNSNPNPNPNPNSNSNPNSNGESTDQILPNYDFHPIRSILTDPPPGALSPTMPAGALGPTIRPADILGPTTNEIRTGGDLGGTKGEIERVLKEQVGRVLGALEGVSARLARLESRTNQVETAVDGLRAVLGEFSGTNEGNLRHFENILREVQAGVQVLRDKQEIVETQLQLVKSSEADTSASSQTLAAVPPQYLSPNQISAPNAPQFPPQIAPNQISAPNAPQFPPQIAPNQISAPNAPQFPPQIAPNQSAPNAPNQSAPNAPHPQFPPQFAPQIGPNQSAPNAPPSQFPPNQSVTQSYFPSQPPPNQQYPPQTEEPNPNSPYTQQHTQFQTLNPTQTYPPRGPSPPSQSFYGPPPIYTDPAQIRPNYNPQLDPAQNRPNYNPQLDPYAYNKSSSPSYRTNPNPNSSPFTPIGSQTQTLPTAKILPQAGPAQNASNSNPNNNRVALDDVVEKVAMMGFSREQVRATVRKLTENGQNVDLNVVLDKLMNDGDVIQPQKGWFNR